MPDDIVLPVPETVSAVYLVPAGWPLYDPVGVARRYLDTHIGEPLLSVLRDLIDGPLCSIETVPSAEMGGVPGELLRMFGGSAELVEQAERAEHLLVVSAMARPGWPPYHEWTARAVATALADALDAPVIDYQIPRITPAAALAATLPDGRGALRLADWVLVPRSVGVRGAWLTTKGLGRFGLPELQALDVPPELAEPWSRALTGVASALLARWSTRLREAGWPALVTLPSRLEFTVADVGTAYGEPRPPGGLVAVELALSPSPPSQDSFLTVAPPHTYPSSAAEYLDWACSTLFGPAGAGR